MNWKGWENKYVSMRLRNGATHSGKVIKVDISGGELIWITIEKHDGNKATFVHSEITEIFEVKA